jgi:transcriptional regulator with XRE-family HTH domain
MARQTNRPSREVLAILRVIRRWTREELAGAAGMKLRTVHAYERGERPLGPPVMHHLASAMGFPAGVLDRTASFVEHSRALLDGVDIPAGEEARQGRVARVAAGVGQWFEDLARTALTRALLPAETGRSREPAAPAPSPGSATLPGSAGAAAAARLLGEALTILRLIRQVSQTELGAASGVKRDSISDYERGRFMPRPDVLRRLVEAMGFSAAMVERTLAFVDTVCAAQEGSALASAGSASAAQIEELAGEEGRAIEDFTRRRFMRLALAARTLASRRGAPALWARLADRSPEEQRRLLDEDSGLWSSGLCELLCEESVEAAGDSAARAVHLAQLAVRVAKRVVEDRGWRLRLEGYALAHLANARRVAGDLLAADRQWGRAAALWAAGAEADPGLLSEARVLSLEASLRREQRRLPDALALADRALALDRWGETTRLLIGKAKALEETGAFDEAIQLLRQAGSRIDGQREPQLLFWVNKNLAVNLCQVGRHAEAEIMLAGVRSMALRLGKKLELVRVKWLEGKVAAGLGRSEQALTAFERVRREFGARGIAYDAALATLELAEVHAALGHAARVKALARESAPVFRDQGVHREAQAALELFRAAAEAERPSMELIRGVIAYLYRARHDPDLRFEAPA